MKKVSILSGVVVCVLLGLFAIFGIETADVSESDFDDEGAQISKNTTEQTSDLTSAILPLSVNTCDDLAGFNQVSTDFAKSEQALQQYFITLQNAQLPWQYLEALAQQVGLTAKQKLQVLPSYPDTSVQQNKSNLYDGYVVASDEQIERLTTFIANEQEHRIIELLTGSDKKLFKGLPLLSYVLRHTQKPALLMIEQLIEQGVKPTLFDIVLALRQKLNTDIIALLINHSIDNKNHIWQEYQQHQSLSLIAATSFDVEVLSLWLNKVDQKNSQNDGFSELDVLPQPNGAQIERGLAVVNLLLEHGRKVQTLQGMLNLQVWLPHNWFSDNYQRLNVFNIEQVDDVKVHIQQLKALFDDYKRLVLAKASLVENCPNFVSNGQQANVAEQNQLKQNLVQFRQRLLSYNPPFPIAELYRAQTKDHLTLRTELVSALNGKDWQEALRLVELLKETEFESVALQSTLLTALSFGGSLSFIESLLARGAQLPDEAINLLAFGADVAVAQGLMNHGLKLDYINPMGLNALEYVIYFNADFVTDMNRQITLLEFLLDNGVSISNTESSNHLDALNYALMKLDNTDAAIFYAQFLVEAGIAITNNHMSQVENISVRDSQKYQQLIEQVPELELGLKSSE